MCKVRYTPQADPPHRFSMIEIGIRHSEELGGLSPASNDEQCVT